MKEQQVCDETENTPRKNEERLYIGTKMILGIEMDECTFLREYKKQDTSNRKTQPGYRVQYEDGYISWSLKKTFENAYRQVTEAEKRMMK